MKLSAIEINKINSTKVKGIKLQFINQTDNVIMIKWGIFSFRTIVGSNEPLSEIITRLIQKVEIKWTQPLK